MLDNLLMGFGVAFTFQNLLYALGGVLVGTLIGVLPGLGPIATIAMLLPSVYGMDALPALIMLAGIYYGAQYGGSTTAILLNVPGEATSVVTTLDGYQMARKGRAGAALSIAALGSFFAGCVGTLVIALFAPPLVKMAQQFGSHEYVALMVLGLVAAVILASGSFVKALAMVVLGVLLGQVNSDVISGVARFSFDRPELADGFGVVVVAMGLFGFGELIAHLAKGDEQREVFTKEVHGLMPTKEDLKAAFPAMVRGTALGSLLGALPGNAAMLGAFASYTIEKKLAKDPSRFGKGAIEGVAAPESANNAGAQVSFVPLLVLGIPPNGVMALMAGAMVLKGIQPGPQVMTANPELFWGLIASMWIGNLMLVVLNLPLVGMWVKLLTVPYRLLFPAIVCFCCVGAYSINNNPFDVLMTAGFATLGYVFHKLHCEPVPLLLGFILGPLMEENLRRALLISRGDWSSFLSRPLSASLLAAALLVCFVVLLPSISKKREETFKEED
jgi:putative tricarboxylic transport membrane protein